MTEAGSGNDDDVDPSDWLSSQFGEETVERPARRTPPPLVPPTAAPPPPAVVSPPAVAPSAPPPAAGGFTWGLTPGGGGAPAPTPLPAEPPIAPPQPAVLPPVSPPTALPAAPPAFTPPPLVPQTYTPPPLGASPYTPPPFATTPVEPVPPAVSPPPFTPPPAYIPPAYTHPRPDEPPPTVAMAVDTTSPGSFAPLDPALDGVTEAIGAHQVGLPDPVDEGLETSAIDSLFGDTAFAEYADELVPALPPRPSGGELVRVERPPKAPRAPLPLVQKVLMGVAGSLVAILALIALFLVGTRLSNLFPAPAAIVTPSPTPTETLPATLPIGPVVPGEYYWDQLLGGECLEPYESPWQDTYVVVGCTEPHGGQLVYRGSFDDPEFTPYPGVEALAARIPPLCSVATVIDYAAAVAVPDVQIAASFAPDAEDWDAGNRTFFCFAARTGPDPLTASIAVPQVAVVPAPAETPAP